MGIVSGRLNRRIVLYEPGSDSPAYNDAGEEQRTFAEYGGGGSGARWAELVKQSGRELYDSGKYSEVEAVWRIRFESGIDTTFRLTYDGQTYEILSINDDRFNDLMELATKAHI